MKAEKIKLLLFLALMLAYLFLGRYIIENPYNILSAPVNALITLIIIILVIVVFKAFTEIKYFKSDSVRSRLSLNFPAIIFIIMLYFIFVSTSSGVLFITMSEFTKNIPLKLFPEKYSLLLPSFIGISILFLRITSNYDFLYKKKKISISGYFDLDLTKYIDNINFILYNLLIGVIVLGYIGAGIFRVTLPKILGAYSFNIYLYSAIYGFFFAIVDIAIGITHPTETYRVTKPLIEEEIEPDEKPQFIKEHPKITIAFILFLIIIGTYGIYEFYTTQKIPFIVEEKELTAYNIGLTISSNLENAKIHLSEDVFRMQKEPYKAAIPIISIDNENYTLSSRFKSLKQSGILDYSDLGTYLIEDISPKKLNFTIKRRNVSIESFDPNNLYYFSTEYDSPIFLALHQNGYTNLISYGVSIDAVTIQTFQKIIFAEKEDKSVGIKMFFQGGAFMAKRIDIITTEDKIAQELKEKIEGMEEDVTVEIFSRRIELDELTNLKFGK